jgi:mannose-1-phosphate guanylyltransferase
MHRDFYTVIPAGGAGTRLWPLSRASRPKFLLPLIDGKSLLQLTAERVSPFSPPDRIYTVSGSAHLAAIARQLPQLPESNLLVEPGMRGTGNAIALAALLIAQRDPDAVMGSFASDHKIGNTAEFHRVLRTAIASAEAGYLTTIGIEPSHPETGYGYIERSDDLALSEAYFARRFVEKPDLATAERFLESGRYLWNASMFVWRVDVFLREFKRVQPALLEKLQRVAKLWGDPSRAEEIERIWLDLPVTTIDQGLMEHVDEFVVVPVEMGWSDIGDWHGFAELLEANADRNCIKGNVISQNASDCVVWSDQDRPIALVGVQNIAVIDLPDALLIVDRNKAQDVRAIVSKLERERPDLT